MRIINTNEAPPRAKARGFLERNTERPTSICAINGAVLWPRTYKNSNLKIQNAQLFLSSVAIFTLLTFAVGCSKEEGLKEARQSASRSTLYYETAVSKYKKLISSGRDDPALYFELGRLYYRHGDFEQAIEAFRKAEYPAAKKYLAIASYRIGNFTEALEVFNKNASRDPEYLYYYGLTCERLHLFDQALSMYRKINDGKFKPQAASRINLIEKQVHPANIKDIDQQTQRIIACAPSKDKYPQAGALILYADEKIEITAQNTQVTHLHYIVKIINERGKEEFAETAIGYDSTYERVELEYARTIKPDGAVVEVGTRHIRDVSKYLNFPLYSNARVYIISFPEVVEGACIEYKLKILRSQLVNKKDFVLLYPLQAYEPVVDAYFEIKIPEKQKLFIKNINEQYNYFRAQMKAEIDARDGWVSYRWQIKDIPQIIPEANMPPLAQINPTILISTFPSWDEVYRWWWALASDKISADSAIKNKVAELIRNCASDDEKARSLYNFCAQKIRYVAVEYGQAGYEPHKAEDIFKNKYGDCKDQAILLISMLKEAGLEAYPVLIATRDYYATENSFPSIIFNHCIAAVMIDGKMLFLDPTAQTCAFGDLPRDDQARKVLVFRKNSYSIEETPRYGASHNMIKQILKITVANNETINAQREVFTSGIYDQAQRYWLLYTPPQLIQETLQERIQDISIARLANYSIDNLTSLDKPIILRYSFKGTEYFTSAGNLRILPQLAALETSLVAKDTRRYAIDFGVLDIKELIFEIEISDGFVIKYIPTNVVQKTPWFNFLAEYRTEGNKKIFFRQKIEILKDKVSEKEYPLFKAAFENIVKGIKQRIVVERTQ